MPHNVAEIHLDTAADFKVGEVDTVMIETPRASVTCQVNITEDILPNVVQLFHGFADANANLLTDSSSSDPVTGSVPMRSSLCRMSKAQA
jgi:anaerobic selenocysteine-containing dehydrogenase